MPHHEPDEPEDLRPPEPKDTAYMSGNEKSDDNMQISSTTKVVVNPPATENDHIMAKVCEDRLSKANDEFMAKMEEISKMPADPNFTPEEIETEEDTFVCGTADDGSKAMAGVQTKVSIKS